MEQGEDSKARERLRVELERKIVEAKTEMREEVSGLAKQMVAGTERVCLKLETEIKPLTKQVRDLNGKVAKQGEELIRHGMRLAEAEKDVGSLQDEEKDRKKSEKDFDLRKFAIIVGAIVALSTSIINVVLQVWGGA